MSVSAACPWCKAPVEDTSRPCPRCGRRGDEGASAGAVVPDLDLPARPSRGGPAVKPVAAAAVVAPAAQPGAKAPPPPTSSHQDHGSRFDADADVFGGDDAPRIEIDLNPQEAPPASLAKVAVPQPAAPPKPLDRRTASPETDPYEARALSDYGDPPDQWWRTPMYAYRVLRRQPELKKLVTAKKREADRTQGAAEDALLTYAEIVRPKAEKLGGYARVFDEVRATEQVLRERDAVLGAETDAHKQRAAEFDAKIAQLEAELAHVQVEERQVAGEWSEADALLKRAEARVKRVDIEIRNAVTQANEGAQPDQGEPKGP